MKGIFRQISEQMPLLGGGVGLLMALAGTAAARVPPSPPPSGIVLHPFALQGGPPGATMSTPAILRQMFITGDPDAKPRAAIPKGKAAQQP